MKESGRWSNGTGRDLLQARTTSKCTPTQEPKIDPKIANDGASHECQKRAQRSYLKVRPLRDLMFRKMIKGRRSRVPNTRLPAEDTITFYPHGSKEGHRRVAF